MYMLAFVTEFALPVPPSGLFAMIRPLLSDQPLLEDMAEASSLGDFFLWWLGQSGFLLKWDGAYALLDPYLSDSLTEKYAGTATEHIRLTERCLAPATLDFVTVVASSHVHTDHCDAATLRPLADVLTAQGRSLPLVLPKAVRALAGPRLGERGIDFLPLDAGEELQVGPFAFRAVPAAHPTVERDSAGRHLYLGYVVRFGPWTLYHSGDTVWYDGLSDALRSFRVDVALLPINGNDPSRGVAGNLDGREAASLAREIGARVVIPQHFEMFGFNTASPEEFVRTCDRLGQDYAVLRCGERWSSSRLGKPFARSAEPPVPVSA